MMNNKVQSCVKQIQNTANKLYARCKEAEEIALRKGYIIKQLQQSLRDKSSKLKDYEIKIKNNELAVCEKVNKENQQLKMNMETAQSATQKKMIDHIQELEKENKKLKTDLALCQEDVEAMRDENDDLKAHCMKLELKKGGSELQSLKEENRRLKKVIKRKNDKIKQYRLHLDDQNDAQYADDADESDPSPSDDSSGAENIKMDVDALLSAEEEEDDDDEDYDPDEPEEEDYDPDEPEEEDDDDDIISTEDEEDDMSAV